MTGNGLALVDARGTACVLYLFGGVTLCAALSLRAETAPRHPPFRAIERARARGEVEGLPRLDPNDAMANSAVLMAAIDRVPMPGAAAPDGAACIERPRFFSLITGGRMSRVRFNVRQVCQLKTLKRASVVQPGFDVRGLGEVAAFVLGRRVPGTDDVDVSRVLVPPFRFTGDSITFVSADLGPLAPGESLIGTFHTHPEGDVEQGLLSDTDLRYMRDGHVDFHGRVGWLIAATPADGLDWIFDIVEPRDGDWNVYAHDHPRLAALLLRCDTTASCPLDQLRTAGSPYDLLTRWYEERDEPHAAN